jgi:hypothetical protein
MTRKTITMARIMRTMQPIITPAIAADERSESLSPEGNQNRRQLVFDAERFSDEILNK